MDRRTHAIAAIAFATAVLAAATPVRAQNLEVVSVDPPARSLGVPVLMPVSVTFDRPLNLTSVNSESFRVFGRWTGRVQGTVSFSAGNQVMTLTPGADTPMFAGDSVMVILSHDLRGQDGQFLRAAGYSFQFRTRAEAADVALFQIDQMSTRSDCCTPTRAYGGAGTDFNNDGWADITIINEISADMRVFLNTADGSGFCSDFLLPPSPLGNIASPSDTADFNNDGNGDICVVNDGSGSLSVLLGHGDGTFEPQQQIPVGGAPRGICVLDADGDGDPDIVNGNSISDNLSLLLNNGNGQFGSPAPIFFGSGVAGEWGVSANDMNNDGILDVVVLGQAGEQVAVLRGNGNGTFTPIASQSSGGNSRTLAVNDLNGDGNEDVVIANGMTNNVGVLFGNGAGSLSAPVIIPTDPFTGSVDLGDLDGDGDLDLVVASFLGNWQFYLNNGNGGFAYDQSVDAPQVASCAILADMDNDRDLDAVLVDEIADIFKIITNSGSTPAGDATRDGVVDIDDLFLIVGSWGPCDALPAPCPADLTGNGTVDIDDLFFVVAGWRSVG